METQGLESPPISGQQPGESALHFAWFCAFLEMGPSRSVRGAYKIFYGKSPKVPKSPQVSPSWKAACEKWNWRGRVGAWDAVQRGKRLQLIQDRERAIIDQIFAGIQKQLDMSAKVDHLAEFILKYPLTEVSTADGVTTIMPAKWTFDTGIRAFVALGQSSKQALELLALLGELERSAILREEAADPEARVFNARFTLEAAGYTVSTSQEAPTLSPTQLREKENARLDVLETLAHAQAQQGVPGAVERALRIAQRRARLNGLDKPFDSTKEDAPKRRREMSGFSDIELSILEEMMGEGEEE